MWNSTSWHAGAAQQTQKALYLQTKKPDTRAASYQQLPDQLNFSPFFLLARADDSNFLVVTSHPANILGKDKKMKINWRASNKAEVINREEFCSAVRAMPALKQCFEIFLGEKKKKEAFLLELHTVSLGITSHSTAVTTQDKKQSGQLVNWRNYQRTANKGFVTSFNKEILYQQKGKDGVVERAFKMEHLCAIL